MCHPLQDSLLCLSAATAGVAAGRGEVDKDSRHESGGHFYSFLVVETLGLWSLNSLIVLKNVALRTISKSGASSALAFCHFLEQLSMCLWRYNSQMLLHHLSLLPGGSWPWVVDPFHSSLYLAVFATLPPLATILSILRFLPL